VASEHGVEVEGVAGQCGAPRAVLGGQGTRGHQAEDSVRTGGHIGKGMRIRILCVAAEQGPSVLLCLLLSANWYPMGFMSAALRVNSACHVCVAALLTPALPVSTAPAYVHCRCRYGSALLSHLLNFFCSCSSRPARKYPWRLCTFVLELAGGLPGLKTPCTCLSVLPQPQDVQQKGRLSAEAEAHARNIVDQDNFIREIASQAGIMQVPGKAEAEGSWPRMRTLLSSPQAF
jgi:hypothetical protein